MPAHDEAHPQRTPQLVDVARSSSVWQGVAEGRIPEEALRNPGPAVDEAVRSIFRQFPDATQK